MTINIVVPNNDIKNSDEFLDLMKEFIINEYYNMRFGSIYIVDIIK
jgi:hypothetical protein